VTRLVNENGFSMNEIEALRGKQTLTGEAVSGYYSSIFDSIPPKIDSK